MVIIPLARILGSLFAKIKQPMVIGEILAGLFLGPSLLGWAAPNVYHFIFPAQSLSGLNLLSQVGLIFFMFLVGLEFNPTLLRGRGKTAWAVSHASIIVPFALGVLLAFYLYPKYSDPNVRMMSFGLFMGASMSVTAFPVLARILTERKMTHTSVGAMALTCGAVDDVTAWFLLAVVISFVHSTGFWDIAKILGWTTVYVVFMVAVLRPLLKKFERRYSTREGLSQNAVAIVFLLLLASSFATESIGIHALFGAFFLGAIMPTETSFVKNLTEKIEDIAVLFLLPLFFAYTGLHTEVGLLSSSSLWVDAGLILLVACAGKFGGSFVASKWMGLQWKEAGAIGVLMNTRGLMELVILSIGLELGVISPTIFTMMVLMALITTVMTTPLLEWIYPAREMFRTPAEPEGTAAQEKPFTILISVALPRSGSGLVTVAAAISGPKESSRIYALHLNRLSERPSNFVKGARLDEEMQLKPLIEKAEGLGVEVRPLSFFSNDPAEDIVDVAKAKAADLVLLGWHKPLLGQRILGGTVRKVMEDASGMVGVFIDRGMSEIRKVLVPFLSNRHDMAALILARRLAKNRKAEITILHIKTSDSSVGEGSTTNPSEIFSSQEGESQIHLKTLVSRNPVDTVLEESRQGYDLVLIGVSEEMKLDRAMFGLRPERIAAECPTSLLIVQQKDAIASHSF